MSNFNLTGLKDALTEISDSPALKTVDLKGISQLIKDGKAKNIITMVGAGISTAAGIPDFRSQGSGIYDNLDEYNLPNPSAVFLIDYFRQNPEPFFKVAKRLHSPQARPTLSHYFVKLLHDKGLLKRHYTQNVDHLDRMIGLPDELVIEAHGTFHTGHCMKCTREYDYNFMELEVLADRMPICIDSECKGIVKPDIVFFGESLPSRFFACLEKDFPVCDLLIILGTSLAVAPFSLLVHKVNDNVPRLYINLEADDNCFDSVPWGDKANCRDVLHKGDADAGVSLLADLLGWKDELLELKKINTCRLDKATDQSKSKD